MAFSGIISLFVGITIAVVLVGSVVMPTINTTNTTGWNSAVTTFFTTLLPIAVVAALVMMVIQ